LNPKIFVVVAIAVLIGILGVILMTTSISDTSGEGSAQEIKNPVKSITVELKDVSVLQVSDRSAVLEIQFNLYNPNSRSVIAQLLRYSLYSSIDSEEFKITTGTTQEILQS
jgi:LEA14-like dessication related protein